MARCVAARGVTIIEAVICVFVMSVALTAGLAVTGSIGGGRLALVEKVDGQALADELMAEVLAVPYIGDDLPVINLSDGSARSGAVLPTDRSGFDDLDDFAGWSASPPQAKDGSRLPGYDNWSRSVELYWLADTGARSLTDRGRIFIHITVYRGSRLAATAQAIRTRARDEFSGIELPDDGGQATANPGAN